jgi:signal transduction histidine kinase
MENVRLFDELRARTNELARSLDDLHRAQNRLIQTEKLASLGQLTAGIAHEIKNPLNFVNNFADLSRELVDELEEVIRGARLDEESRACIGELAGMMKANLEKVAQHGRRTDSIVKNMLLHSRQGGGERHEVDLNALIKESLNLAYHGARAEKPGFDIALATAFDPAVGKVSVYAQEFNRVVLNLASNGFHAVHAKRSEGGKPDYEPSLAVSTKAFGDRVEIRIRDNGTGISDAVKADMYNPFFTTKPAGEGTGLGLSLSHDIIVKQHGGTIDVETQPGEFTEFTIVLPRGGPTDIATEGRSRAQTT